MKGLLLISHGPMAKGLYETLTWFFGEDIPQVSYLTLMAEDDVDYFTQLVNNKAEELDSGDGVVIMCDLFGGSPFKSAIGTLLSKPETKLLTGMNLPMAMEFLGMRLSDNYDYSTVVETGKNGMMDFIMPESTLGDDDE